MLFFLDVIGKALGDHPMFLQENKKERKFRQPPNDFFLDVQGEAHTHTLKKTFYFIFIFKSEKTSTEPPNVKYQEKHC